MSNKELLSNLVESVAQDNLGDANRAFKTLMAEKLVHGLNEHAIQVQSNISEAYPDIFDSPVDVKAASEIPDIEEYPEDSDDDTIEPEQGKSEADYIKGEDEEVYEQTVYEAQDDDIEEGDEEDLEEADKPDYIDIDKDGDTTEPMKQAVKDKEESDS